MKDKTIWKKCKVVMLPTEISKIAKNTITKSLSYHPRQFGYEEFHRSSIADPQHLYFVTDDEIKEGDWVLDNRNSCNNLIHQISCTVTGNVKKIVATTDSNFINDKCHCGSINKNVCEGGEGQTCITPNNLPQPSQEFIKEYCKAGGIDEVEVEYWVKPDRLNEFENIPDNKLKINPDNTVNIRKVKDSWNREEVIEFAKKVECFINKDTNKVTELPDWWIEQNL